jgi:hypothetical protein
MSPKTEFEIDHTVKIYRSPDGLFVPLRSAPEGDGWAIRNKLFWAYTADGPGLAKLCTACEEVKLGPDFHYAEKGSGHLASKCKACVSTANRTKGNPEPELEPEASAGPEVLEVDLTEVFERLDQLDAHAQLTTGGLQALGEKLDRIMKELGVE